MSPVEMKIFQDLVLARLRSRSFLDIELCEGVGRVIARRLGVDGLHGLFGDEFFKLFYASNLDPHHESSFLIIGDLLEEILVYWFLRLSEKELIRFVPDNAL